MADTKVKTDADNVSTPAPPDKPEIPPGPWTLKALGKKKYRELAMAYAGFDPDQGVAGMSFTPALDLTPFVGGGK